MKGKQGLIIPYLSGVWTLVAATMVPVTMLSRQLCTHKWPKDQVMSPQ